MASAGFNEHTCHRAQLQPHRQLTFLWALDGSRAAFRTYGPALVHLINLPKVLSSCKQLEVRAGCAPATRGWVEARRGCASNEGTGGMTSGKSDAYAGQLGWR